MNPIVIPTQSGKYFLHAADIVRVQGLDNYSKVFFITGRHLVVSKVLLWFEKRLPQQSFARIHRSHIVNMDHVTRVDTLDKNCVQLSNGELICISRRKKVKVIAAVKAMQEVEVISIRQLKLEAN